MNKLLAFIVSAAILVGIGTWFINNNPAMLRGVANWALKGAGTDVTVTNIMITNIE